MSPNAGTYTHARAEAHIGLFNDDWRATNNSPQFVSPQKTTTPPPVPRVPLCRECYANTDVYADVPGLAAPMKCAYTMDAATLLASAWPSAPAAPVAGGRGQPTLYLTH